MGNPSELAKSALAAPWPDLKRVARAVSHVTRWKMLRELSLGEPREIIELANVAGCSYDSALKHLGVLQRAGLVTRGRGKVFVMHREHLPVPGERVADFGHCVLRLEEAK
jgi:DNA-binding transcriptional ArsR family regulator